jgi:hypothetical protein
MLSRSSENKGAKSEQFAVGFSIFWEVRIMILGHFGGPGHDFWSFWRLRAAPWTHFEDFWDLCDFVTRNRTKGYSLFGTISQPVTHFPQCCFLMFF